MCSQLFDINTCGLLTQVTVSHHSTIQYCDFCPGDELVAIALSHCSVEVSVCNIPQYTTCNLKCSICPDSFLYAEIKQMQLFWCVPFFIIFIYFQNLKYHLGNNVLKLHVHFGQWNLHLSETWLVYWVYLKLLLSLSGVLLNSNQTHSPSVCWYIRRKETSIITLRLAWLK